jgi:hypothetical protein
VLKGVATSEDGGASWGTEGLRVASGKAESSPHKGVHVRKFGKGYPSGIIERRSVNPPIIDNQE